MFTTKGLFNHFSYLSGFLLHCIPQWVFKEDIYCNHIQRRQTQTRIFHTNNWAFLYVCPLWVKWLLFLSQTMAYYSQLEWFLADFYIIDSFSSSSRYISCRRHSKVFIIILFRADHDISTSIWIVVQSEYWFPWQCIKAFEAWPKIILSFFKPFWLLPVLYSAP